MIALHSQKLSEDKLVDGIRWILLSLSSRGLQESSNSLRNSEREWESAIVIQVTAVYVVGEILRAMRKDEKIRCDGQSEKLEVK